MTRFTRHTLTSVQTFGQGLMHLLAVIREADKRIFACKTLLSLVLLICELCLSATKQAAIGRPHVWSPV
jgi:hypothetical protein